LPDGFAGRNAAGARKVATVLAEFVKGDTPLNRLVASYEARCTAVPAEFVAACKSHFKELLAPKK